jgi:hypothetical protein
VCVDWVGEVIYWIDGRMISWTQGVYVKAVITTYYLGILLYSGTKLMRTPNYISR